MGTSPSRSLRSPNTPWDVNSTETFPALGMTAANPPPSRCTDAAHSAESIDASSRLVPSPALSSLRLSILLERCTPDRSHPGARSRVGTRFHHPLSLALERHMMQHRAVADVGIRQPLRRRRLERAHRGQSFE